MFIRTLPYFFFFLLCYLSLSKAESVFDLDTRSFCESNFTVTFTWRGRTVASLIQIYISGDSSVDPRWTARVSGKEGSLSAFLGPSMEGISIKAVLLASEGGQTRSLKTILTRMPDCPQLCPRIPPGQTAAFCNISNLERTTGNTACYEDFSTSGYSPACARAWGEYSCSMTCVPCIEWGDVSPYRQPCCSIFSDCPELAEHLGCSNEPDCLYVPIQDTVETGCEPASDTFHLWCSPNKKITTYSAESCIDPPLILERIDFSQESEECAQTVTKIVCSQCYRCDDLQMSYGACEDDCSLLKRQCSRRFFQSYGQYLCGYTSTSGSCPFEINNSTLRNFLQEQKLKDLFDNCGGVQSWSEPYLTRWVTVFTHNISICLLFGVVCDENGWVVELNLSGVGLSCSSPWSLSMPHLKKLDLSNNRLVHAPTFSSRDQLVELNLENCMISEPQGLWEIETLRQAHLARNYISTLNPLIYSSSITFLNVSYNYIREVSFCSIPGRDLQLIACPQVFPAPLCESTLNCSLQTSSSSSSTSSSSGSTSSSSSSTSTTSENGHIGGTSTSSPSSNSSTSSSSNSTDTTPSQNSETECDHSSLLWSIFLIVFGTMSVFFMIGFFIFRQGISSRALSAQSEVVLQKLAKSVLQKKGDSHVNKDADGSVVDPPKN